MSDDAYDDDLDDETRDDAEPQGQNKGNVHARLRRTEKELEETRAQAEAGAQAIRENAFLKAKIDLTDPKLAAFAKVYDGDLTAEAITAQAVQDGWIDPPPVDPDLQQAAAAARVSTGADAVNDTTEADKTAALAALGPRATPYDVARVVAQFDGDGAVADG